LEPAEGTRTIERLLLPSASLDMFPMDLDAPELIQAIDDFTQQILSPGDMLSSGLEAAITSGPTTISVEVDGVDEINQNEGARIEFTPQEVNEAIRNLQVQIIPLNTDTNTNKMEEEEEKEEEDSTPVASPDDSHTLPLSEPVFQILSTIFDDYNPLENSAKPTSTHIPETKSDFFNPKNLKHDDLNNFLDSYPYDCSWDSPGSVETDNCLFPELSF